MGRNDESYSKNSNNVCLKSLLKKPGVRNKSNNHVVFNETKNEFFDADYIILIREESEYNHDGDEDICTCNKFVSCDCCDSNCDCNMCEQSSQILNFTPPGDYVDTVALSPPEGYKDMEQDEEKIFTLEELASAPPKAVVCKECIATQKEIERDTHNNKIQENMFDKGQSKLEKLENENFVLITSPVSSILKDGLTWEGQDNDSLDDTKKNIQNTKLENSSDDKTINQKSHVIENYDGIIRNNQNEKENYFQINKKENNKIINFLPQETTEMMLTFKFGDNILISNSQKPNSAVRQLFPNKIIKDFEKRNTENLQAIQETTTPHMIKTSAKCIDDHVLHCKRSLIYCEPKTKRYIKKEDNSLVERIKLLTCDLDRSSGEISPEYDQIKPIIKDSLECREINCHNPFITNSSPSSSSTSSNSSSISSTYKRITELFGKKEKLQISMINEDCNMFIEPDLGGPQKQNVNKCNTGTEYKKPLLSTLVPLTACVNVYNSHKNNYNVNTDFIDKTACRPINASYLERNGTGDIYEKFEKSKSNTPDVLAGTPSIKPPINEVSAHVQDNNEVDMVNKKVFLEDQLNNEDDEHDDYGFNKRPNVQGVKKKLNSATEILHQMQNKFEITDGVDKLTWPYYSENNSRGHTHIYTEVLSPPYTYEENKSCKNYYNVKGANRTDINTHFTFTNNDEDYNKCHLSQKRTRRCRSTSPPPQEHNIMYIPCNYAKGHQQSIISSPYATNDFMKLDELILRNENFGENSYFQNEIPSHSNILPITNYRPTTVYLTSNSLSGCDQTNYSLFAQTSVKSTQTSSTPLLTCSYFHNVKYKSMSMSPLWKNYGIRNAGQNMSSNTTKLSVSDKAHQCVNGGLSNEESKNGADIYMHANKHSSNLNIIERSDTEDAPNISSSSSVKSFYAMNV